MSPQQIAKLNKIKFDDSIRNILRNKTKSQQAILPEILKFPQERQIHKKSIALDTYQKIKPKTRLSICNFQLSENKKNPSPQRSATNYISHDNDSARNFDRKILLKFARISDEQHHKQDRDKEGSVREQGSKIKSDGLILNQSKHSKVKIKRGQSLNSFVSLKEEHSRNRNSAESYQYKQKNGSDIHSVNAPKIFQINLPTNSKLPNLQDKAIPEKTSYHTITTSSNNHSHHNLYRNKLQLETKVIKETSQLVTKSSLKKIKHLGQNMKPLKILIEQQKKVQEQVQGEVVPVMEEVCPGASPSQNSQNGKFFYINNLSLKALQENEHNKEKIAMNRRESEKKNKLFSTHQGYSGTRNWNILYNNLYVNIPNELRATKANMLQDQYKHLQSKDEMMKRLGIQINRKQKEQPVIIKQQNMLSGWNIMHEQDHKQLQY